MRSRLISDKVKFVIMHNHIYFESENLGENSPLIEVSKGKKKVVENRIEISLTIDHIEETQSSKLSYLLSNSETRWLYVYIIF